MPVSTRKKAVSDAVKKEDEMAEKEEKVAMAGSEKQLVKYIQEYWCTSARIELAEGGRIVKDGKAMGCVWWKKGPRWYFGYK